MIEARHFVEAARERGFDATFEAYVAAPLAEFVKRGSERERVWLAEQDGRLVGSIAIVAASAALAQLRWFLLDPSVRGQGLGRRLMEEAIGFARHAGYAGVTLWTVSTLAFLWYWAWRLLGRAANGELRNAWA